MRYIINTSHFQTVDKKDIFKSENILFVNFVAKVLKIKINELLYLLKRDLLDRPFQSLFANFFKFMHEKISVTSILILAKPLK